MAQICCDSLTISTLFQLVIIVLHDLFLVETVPAFLAHHSLPSLHHAQACSHRVYIITYYIQTLNLQLCTTHIHIHLYV